MKKGFYPRLALNGIAKNKRLYIPYILTCVAMVTMQYILFFLQHTGTLAEVSGVETLRSIFSFGSYVVALFSAAFLFYTNAFLMRRRKKEFGLYSMLGMGKKNIGRILAWETLLVLLTALGVGLIVGIALSKLAELTLIRLVRGNVHYTLAVSSESVLSTVIVFAVIFVLLLLNTLRQVWQSSTIALMHSESVGEKPPKANWLLGLAGVLVLGAAYYMAVTVEDAYSALVWFFVAVLLVIAATYLLMTAGSVLLCRILQKNKAYYYQTKHFVSVSSMAYRMKRNGAGLASICILATMVLVAVSSTASLYCGAEDSLRTRYPRQINIQLTMRSSEGLEAARVAALREKIDQIMKECGAQPKNITDYRMVSLSGFYGDGAFMTDAQTGSGISGQAELHLIPLDDYNRMTGKNTALAADEALLYTYRMKYPQDTIGLSGGRTLRIKEHLTSFDMHGSAAAVMLPTAFLVVRDMPALLELVGFAAKNDLYSRWAYGFDTALDSAGQIELRGRIDRALKQVKTDEMADGSSETPVALREIHVESREMERADFYGMSGSLFFLGILLSLVFLFAAVLIIYYKQITEGYEDESRFDIMQKVGMTDQEIRSSINAQLKTVFFLPLVGAGLHLSFSFPMIRKLLMLFNLNNARVFMFANIVCFVGFMLIYLVVYRLTSGAYYHIVRGVDRK